MALSTLLSALMIAPLSRLLSTQPRTAPLMTTTTAAVLPFTTPDERMS